VARCQRGARHLGEKVKKKKPSFGFDMSANTYERGTGAESTGPESEQSIF